MTFSASCWSDQRIVLLDHSAMTTGTISMICFPQGWYALVFLLQMAFLAAKFLAFDIHELTRFRVPRMVTFPAAVIRQCRDVIFVGEVDGWPSQFAVNIPMVQNIFSFLGHRTCPDGDDDHY